MNGVLEAGDLFFFYRNVVGVDRARSLDDVQHLFIVLHPDGSEDARMLVVGRKTLPDVEDGASESRGRGWLMTLASDSPRGMAEGLGPLEYETETEGRRRQAEAISAGSGRYALQSVGDESFWIYRLARPDEPGPCQEALGIRREAGYVVAVRNPALDVPGFPDEAPAYPDELLEHFGDLRWVEVRDPRLLDHPNAQLVFIGAFADVDTSDLDLSGAPDVFETFGLDPAVWPREALEDGRFAHARYEAEATAPRGDRSAGGRIGGRRALDAPSAAGIAKALTGIRFPQDREGLVEKAEENEGPEAIVETLEELREGRFEDMADVEEALGEIR